MTKLLWRYGAATLAIALLWCRIAVAQAPEPPTMELRLTDGSVVYGIVVSESPDRVVVRTIAGVTLDVERGKIASLTPARGTVVRGEFRPGDPNGTRLLFTPTGRSLPKGQGYLGLYELVLPFVQVGVTDRFSVGAGTPLVFFGDESVRPIWLTPKFQFYRSPRVAAAAGVMHFVVFGEDVRSGLAYVVATVGSDDSALTVGGGWAYARYREDESSFASCPPGPPSVTRCQPEITRVTRSPGSPVVMVGGEHRLSRRLKLVTENYGFRGGGILSGGVRFIGERLSADVGLFLPLDDEVFIALPIVNFVWLFGTR